MIRRYVCAALTVWLAVLAAPAISRATASTDPLEVQVALEDSVFLEGQSIYAIFTARNVGSDSLRGLAPLAPVYGFMKIALLQEASGQPVPCIMPSDGRYTGSGRNLGPGELFCEARDLTLCFGNVPAAQTTIARKFGYPDLPIGGYVLRWSYLPGPSGYREITGSEIRFAVKPVDSEPHEKRLLNEFISGLPQVGIDRSAGHQYARAWLPRFHGSRYLLRVYMSTGTLLRDVDFDSLFTGAIAAGAPAGRKAALLAARLSMTDYRGMFTPDWKSRIRGHLGSEIERAVLTIEPPRPRLGATPEQGEK